MKNIAIIGTCVLALTFVTLTQAKADLIEKSFAVDQGGTLSIDTDSGSIEIESHDHDTVDVRVKKKGVNAEKFKVTFPQDGKDVVERVSSFGTTQTPISLSKFRNATTWI